MENGEKIYAKPKAEIVKAEAIDVIATSPVEGTEAESGSWLPID